MSDSEYLRYRAQRFRHLAWMTSHPDAKAELETMAREYEERASGMASAPDPVAAEGPGGRASPADRPLPTTSSETAQGQ